MGCFQLKARFQMKLRYLALPLIALSAGCTKAVPEPVANRKIYSPYPKLMDLAYLSLESVERIYGKGVDLQVTSVGNSYKYSYGNGRTFRCWYMGAGVSRVEIQLDEPEMTPEATIRQIVPQFNAKELRQRGTSEWDGPIGNLPIRNISASQSQGLANGYDLVRVEFTWRPRQELTVWQPVDILSDLPDISGFAYASRETLIRSLGKPNEKIKSRIPHPVDHFRLPSGGELSVRYEDGKAISIRLPLGGPFRDPSVALRRVGIDPGLQKPKMSNSSATWTGSVAGLPTKSITVGRDYLGSGSYTTAFTFVQVKFEPPGKAAASDP